MIELEVVPEEKVKDEMPSLNANVTVASIVLTDHQQGKDRRFVM